MASFLPPTTTENMKASRVAAISSTASRIAFNTINENVKNASYAVRGAIVSRSMEIGKLLLTEDGKKTFPFKNIISCNIGNPHALGQKSLTFIRDVLSIVTNPSLIERSGAGCFPNDVIERAKKYLEGTPDVGAYTDSQGIFAVREEVSKFLEKRDGYPSEPTDIFLTNGASEGVRFCMQTILRDPNSGFKDGVLTPIPQYPLYSALTTLLQGHLIPYYLDESNEWGCSANFLTDALTKASANGINARALVVINPGNPTGQVLSEDTMREIVSWCMTHSVCLMADEVYQENIWKNGAKFVSFRKVAKDMNAFDGENGLQMISFHSVSKGFLGECGFRGGYFEILGIPEAVKQEIYKLASISLCSNSLGQIATGLMVNPPSEGEASYAQYVSERDAILASLRRRAVRMTEALNSMEGISCTHIDGAMYAFPTIIFSEKAIKAAQAVSLQPDAFYCLEMLENTGLVVVPGSGFGQEENTHHFRTTILPPEEQMDQVVAELKAFHTSFSERYA